MSAGVYFSPPEPISPNDEVAAHASLGLAGATSYSLLEGH